MTALSLLDEPPDDDQPGDSELLPAPAGWPAPPEEVVYHELPGEIVGTIAPHTEADPVAILTQLLVSFGAAIGRGAWFQVEATRHHGNEYMCLVGDSSRSRKGSSWDHVRRLITGADPSLEPRILTGLSSGEDHRPRPRHPRPAAAGDRARVRVRAEGRQPGDLDAVTDLALRLGRPAARDPDPHRAAQLVLGDVPDQRDVCGAGARRRLLPEGGDPDPLHNTGLDRLLAASLRQARTAGQVRLDPDARELWHHAYRRLAAEPQDQMVAQITARAEAHTIRLALLYTLTDGKRQIATTHLTAALALQDYAARSAAWALTGTTGQPLAEQIHTILRAHPSGLTRSQISQALNHNQPAGQIETALHALHAAGRATAAQIPTGGRPAQLWTATGPSTQPP